MLESLRKILRKRKKQLPQSRELLAFEICQLFEEIVKDSLGRNLSFKALFFKNGTLFVKASNPSLRQELKLLEKEIIKKINQKIGKDLLKRIVYRI